MNHLPALENLPNDHQMGYAWVHHADNETDNGLYFLNRYSPDQPIKPLLIADESLKFGVALQTVDNESDLVLNPTEAPILYKMSSTHTFKLYGLNKNQHYELTEVDPSIVSRLFPEGASPKRMLPLGNVPPALYEHIQDTGAHHLTLESAIRTLVPDLKTIPRCSREQLATLSKMTGHDYLQENNRLPKPLQQEINLLYELVINPTKNINATENIDTCIANRRIGLMAKMQGHEALLSQISLTGNHKQSLIDNAKDAFNHARQNLTTTLDTTYHEGKDTLPLKMALFEAFNLTVRFQSEHDLPLLNGLSPDEINTLCREEAIQAQIQDLLTLDNLIILCIELSQDQLKAFLAVMADDTVVANVIETPARLAGLLINLNAEKFNIIVEALKEHLLTSGMIRNFNHVSGIIELLPAPQQKLVLDVFRDQFIQKKETSQGWESIVIKLNNHQDKDEFLQYVFDKLVAKVNSVEDFENIAMKVPFGCSIQLNQLNLQSITQLIQSVGDFYRLVKRLSENNKVEVYQHVKERLYELIQSSIQFDGINQLLPETIKAELFQQFKERIPQFIQSAIDFFWGIQHLQEKNKTEVYELVKERIPQFIQSARDFAQVAQFLPETNKAEFYEQIKERYPQLIQSADDFSEVVRYLPEPLQINLCQSLGEKLPSLITTVNEFFHVAEQLSPEAIKKLLEQLHDSLPLMLIDLRFRQVLQPEKIYAILVASESYLPSIINSFDDLNKMIILVRYQNNIRLVLGSIANKIPSIIPSIQHVTQLFPMFNQETTSIMVNVLSEHWPVLIPNLNDLIYLLQKLDNEQGKLVCSKINLRKLDKLVQECVPGFYISNVPAYYQTLISESLFEQLVSSPGNDDSVFWSILFQQDSKYYETFSTQFIHQVETPEAFRNIVISLNPQQIIDFYQRLRDSTASLINNASVFFRMMGHLSDDLRLELYLRMSDNLAGLIENSYDVKRILEVIPPEHKTDCCQRYMPKFIEVTDSGSDIARILEHLPDSMRLTYLNPLLEKLPIIVHDSHDFMELYETLKSEEQPLVYRALEEVMPNLVGFNFNLVMNTINGAQQLRLLKRINLAPYEFAKLFKELSEQHRPRLLDVLLKNSLDKIQSMIDVYTITKYFTREETILLCRAANTELHRCFPKEEQLLVSSFIVSLSKHGDRKNPHLTKEIFDSLYDTCLDKEAFIQVLASMPDRWIYYFYAENNFGKPDWENIIADLTLRFQARDKELASNAKPAQGSSAKKTETEILNDFKQQIEQTTTKEELQALKAILIQSNDYKQLSTHQGYGIRYFFNRNTSAITTLNQFIQQQEMKLQQQVTLPKPKS